MIIGHLLEQLASVAKEINQELIDSAAQTIADRHTDSCQISKYVHEKEGSSTGLRIEDVRSLLSADKATTTFGEKEAPDELPVVISTYTISSNEDVIAASIIEGSLHVVTTVDSRTTSPTDEPLCMATSTIDTHSEQTNMTPLHMVTPAMLPDTAIPQALEDITKDLALPSADDTLSITSLPNTADKDKLSSDATYGSNEPLELSSIEPLCVVMDESFMEPLCVATSTINTEQLLTRNCQHSCQPMCYLCSGSKELSTIEPLHVVTDDLSLEPPILTPISAVPDVPSSSKESHELTTTEPLHVVTDDPLMESSTLTLTSEIPVAGTADKSSTVEYTGNN